MNNKYIVMFCGSHAQGEALIKVKAKVAAVFKLKHDQVERLFANKRVPIRRDLSLDQAQKYKAAFDAAGALCEILQQEENEKSVPAAPTGATKPSAKTKQEPFRSAEEIKQAFSGSIPQVAVPLRYRLGLFAVAGAMLLLPIIYVLLVLVLIGAGSWYMVNGLRFFHGSAVIAFLAFYVTPIIVAFVTVLFMVKPLFASPARQAKPFQLARSQEPLFFAFIEKIADTVGAPRPTVIQVDAQVNASASFRRGLRSFFGHDLVLTVGMPLVAGLNTRHLAGILAHELGHFAQGAGMRATYLIWRINYWFYQCVYERDVWDLLLERWMRSSNQFVASLMAAANLGVGFVRLILGVLMRIGDMISRFMSREMELDADRYEALLVGSNQFRAVAFRMRLLNHAFNDVFEQLGEMWADRKLVDDLTHVVVQRASQLESSLKKQIDQEISDSKTNVFDTHPADAARIRNAESMQAQGIFTHEAPAASLLKNFRELAKNTTWHFYHAVIGLRVKPDQLLSTSEMMSAMERVHKAQDALGTYFHGFFDEHYFLSPPDFQRALAVSPSTRVARLAELVGQVRGHGPKIKSVITELAKVNNDLIHYYAETAVAQYRKQMPDSAYETTSARHNDLQKAWAILEKVFTERLGLGLAEAVNKADQAEQLTQEINALLSAQAGLAHAQAAYLTAYRDAAAVSQLAQLPYESRAAFESALRPHVNRLKEDISRIKAILAKINYPFPRAGGAKDVMSHIADELPTDPFELESRDYLEFIGVFMGYAYALLEVVSRFHARVMGQLAAMATSAESALGLRVKLVDLSSRQLD